MAWEAGKISGGGWARNLASLTGHTRTNTIPEFNTNHNVMKELEGRMIIVKPEVVREIIQAVIKQELKAFQHQQAEGEEEGGREGDESTFLTQNEAAAFLRINVKTLIHMRAKGQIAFSRIGRKVLYRKRDLLAYGKKGQDQ